MGTANDASRVADEDRVVPCSGCDVRGTGEDQRGAVGEDQGPGEAHEFDPALREGNGSDRRRTRDIHRFAVGSVKDRRRGRSNVRGLVIEPVDPVVRDVDVGDSDAVRAVEEIEGPDRRLRGSP